jgi:hypothetical protein
MRSWSCLEAHIYQASKEAFAMWCHNAMHQSYEPVWVVLTDLEKVCDLRTLTLIIPDRLGNAIASCGCCRCDAHGNAGAGTYKACCHACCSCM